MLANFFGKSNPANFIITFLLFSGFYAAALFLNFSIDEITSQGAIKHLSTVGLYILLFFFFNFII